MGGIFCDGTPVWGRGMPRVVVVAQNGTVGCGKGIPDGLASVQPKAPRVTNQALGKAQAKWWVLPKVLEAAGGDAYDAPPFFRGWLDSSVGRATD